MSLPDAPISNITLAHCAEIFADLDKVAVEELPQQNMLRLSLKDAAASWPDLWLRLFFHDDFGHQSYVDGRYNGLEIFLNVKTSKAYTADDIGCANAAWEAANPDECSSMFVLDKVKATVKLKYAMIIVGGVTREHIKRVATMIWRHSLGVEKFVN